MDGDIAGIRINPSVVEFFNTETTKSYQINVTVKNISKSSKNIRYYGPKSKSFNLKVNNPELPVAPGLCVPAVIEYTASDTCVVKDRLVVTVDGEVVEIPVFAYSAQPSLEVDRGVDFGNVVANSKVLSKTVKIVNHGSKPGEFRIKYTGSKPVAVVPTNGIVPAKSMQSVKVELVTNTPDKIDEEFKVKLEGCEGSKVLRVRANIMERALELLSMETEEKIDCIKFGSTYYGTDRTQHAILYNNGPEPVSFVAILDEDAIAQEAGVDLTMTIAGNLAEQSNSGDKTKGKTNMLTSLVTAIPNQGILAPWEKTPIFFRFSPRWHPSRQGWKTQTEPAPRKDFALFMHIQMIGANNGFLQNTTENNSQKCDVEGLFVEVALTGTALPVLLDVMPDQRYEFGECVVGERVDLQCTLVNHSTILPTSYQFRKIAHFSVNPPMGKIAPTKSQNITVSFAPNQVGTFKPQQLVDVIGPVADDRNPITYRMEVIHSVPLQFVGRCAAIAVKKEAKFNPGITPLVSNEVGMYVDTKMSELRNDTTRNAVSYALKSKLHTQKSALSSADEDATVSFPNDRARSIRPSNRNEKYRTIFTQAERHNFVDPDYAYTDEEEVAVKAHKYRYRRVLRNLQQRRINNAKEKEFFETNNPQDIGIKTAAGIHSRKISPDQIKPDPPSPRPPNEFWKLLSRKDLASAELDSIGKPIQDGLNAVPVSEQEKSDCKKILSPQELHRIIIGPPVVDFGQVCLRSVNNKDLNIINNLDQYIHVVAEVDCKELRQTSPLSQVIPPNSRASLPFIFESSTKGKFQRSVSYTVNGFYKDHVTVQAEVVAVGLELSTGELTLYPSPGIPAEGGFRGAVTLYNKLNYAADFTWSPNLGEKGTAFSIRPASGTVEPFQDLACEVVWHPSYLAPQDGSFSLLVHGGNTLQFHCKAELGDSNVQFMEHRLLFGQAPINLTTTRKSLLQNRGQNHAYFQVMDPYPFEGLMISPVHGVVPVGGHAELQVSLTPNAILKFDTRLEVAIKGWKTIELRVGGAVEPPSVDIDIKEFSFGGVYCGSGGVVSFRLINRMTTKARIEIDLSRHTDFTLNFPRYQTPEDYMYQLLNPGMYTVSILPEQTVEGELVFMPTEVAAYDFVMPIMINQTKAPTPSPTPLPCTPSVSHKSSNHIVQPRPHHVQIITPRRHVVATALRQPLQLSTNQIEISLPYDFFEMAKASGVGHTKGSILVNNSDKPLHWAFDLSKPNKALDEGVFRFVHESGAPFIGEGGQGVEGTLQSGQTETICINFCPKEAGVYDCLVPVILNGDKEKPYQYIRVVGLLKSPRLWFDPPVINLTPAPLHTEVSTDFTVLAAQYRKATKIDVTVAEVECVDGSFVSPFKVFFPEGNELRPCCGDESQPEPFALPCRVLFSSPKPISCRVHLQFTDEAGKCFNLAVTASADNCLLSCYPFLALHRTDHQIVCEQGVTLKGRKTASKESVDAGEAVFVACASPTHNSRPSTSATSSNFMVSSSSYETSVSESTGSTPMPRNGAMNKPPSASEQYSSQKLRPDMASRSLGSAMFPDEDSEEGAFHSEVLLGAQRWFSAQGWPGGPYPITVPQTLRCGISRKPREEVGGVKGKGGWHLSSVKKEFKTVYDMISHLSGRPMPGIPINTPLPSDPVERIKQVFWQHSTLLTFLRCQGACISAIKPQYLMEPRDFKLWKTLLEIERQSGEGQDMEGPSLEDEALEDEAFEAISKRAWSDILLQTYKCLVLAKITPRTLRTLALPNKGVSLPPVNPDPLCSNVYSVGERIILAWLNHHYEHYRLLVWEKCLKGGVPPSRWVVNFDFDLLDGLVLGALLGAHMPFLVDSHLSDMYTHPNSAEQCLHNALKVVNAMRYAGIDYDIQAIDITDPNPITMLMLAVHLYQKLPQYIPKSTVDFSGALHAKVVRQVKLNNPSSKPLVYQVLLTGRDARDFRIQKGDSITVPTRSTFPLSIEFSSRFLHPAEASLVLIGRRQGSAVGSTLVFRLATQVDNIVPRSVIKVEGPCYELSKCTIDVTNPFPEGGEFHVILMEAKGNTQNGDIGKSVSLLKPKEKKKKKIRSKVDHGQSKSDTPPPPVVESTEKPDVVAAKEEMRMMKAFFSPKSSIFLPANGSASVDIHFLPFTTGERQCSVILTNEKIGELFYSVEASAVLPLSSVLPFKATSSSSRITSAAAAGHGKGMFGGDERVVYWRCEVGQTLSETLVLPVVNATREKALLIASQQLMSDVEIERRRVTGTLLTSAVTARALSTLCSQPAHSSTKLTQAKPREDSVFTVELNSKHFSVPSTVAIPAPGKSLPKGVNMDSVPSDFNLQNGILTLPIKFKATDPGHYPCEIVLKCQDDIRVVKVECTVNPPGFGTELEFSAPVHQSVIQNIPIMNSTTQDWHLRACIEGEGFSGPPTLLVKAGQTSNYPLMFRPMFEADIYGKATLTNVMDRTDHVYMLVGNTEKPLALDNIVVQCPAMKTTVVPVLVPNLTQKKLVYAVESDLNCVGGNMSVSVLPGKSGTYNMEITPSRRGTLKGIVSFTAGKNPVVEIDSDGDEIPSIDEESAEYQGYQVWYSLQVNVTPPPPQRSIEVKSPCHKRVVVEVMVRNPTAQEISLSVTIEGRDLSGPPSITLQPGSTDVYLLTYFPGVIGRFSGSLIFYNDQVGEFWYELNLIGESPLPTILPPMECELGRWTTQNLTLRNPTNETLELISGVSNTNNFTLERDNERPILLLPQSEIDVPVNFMPSTLGEKDHSAKISFFTQQLGEWVFRVSGTGLLPSPQQPTCVYTTAGSNTTLIIPFRNPTDTTVTVNILLKEKEREKPKKISFPEVVEESPFCLLLKHRSQIRVGPKSSLDIPISFAPTGMRLYEALCSVVMAREDGKVWPYIPSDDQGKPLSNTSSEGLTEICWRFPIHGIPESQTVKDSQAQVLECRARERLEERLEVTLTGVATSAAGVQQDKGMKTRAITPKNEAPRVPEGIIVGEGTTVAAEFTYELVYGSTEIEEIVKNSVAISLVRQQRDKVSGLVTLIFNVVYAPFKAMNYNVHLHVRAATGGVWKFPLKFSASEPEVDDTITVEATGLGRLSSVAFRLHSHSSHPLQYKAYFLAGSDPELSVSPQTGELLPHGTPGTLIQVDFLPNVYGKLYQGKLIVQTSEMQWSYAVQGVLPEYCPPKGRSSAPMAGPHPDPRARRERLNFIRHNLKLNTTAVSSPIKGAPLIERTKIM